MRLLPVPRRLSIRCAHTPFPFPLAQGSAIGRATAVERRIPVAKAFQWRWANTELQRTP